MNNVNFKIIFALIATLLLFGCSNLQRINADQFNHRIERPLVGKADVATFIGTTEENAYLERKYYSFTGWNTEILWVPLKELPEETIQKLNTKGLTK